jgi:hypothetical protein
MSVHFHSDVLSNLKAFISSVGSTYKIKVRKNELSMMDFQKKIGVYKKKI